MYKQEKVHDRREMLRVKVKSLAAEARIIRQEEQRTHGQLRFELHEHRVGVVRDMARSSHLAYGFIRGRTHDEMEPTRKSEPDWEAVRRMCKRYGPAGYNGPPQ